MKGSRVAKYVVCAPICIYVAMFLWLMILLVLVVLSPWFSSTYSPFFYKSVNLKIVSDLGVIVQGNVAWKEYEVLYMDDRHEKNHKSTLKFCLFNGNFDNMTKYVEKCAAKISMNQNLVAFASMFRTEVLYLKHEILHLFQRSLLYSSIFTTLIFFHALILLTTCLFCEGRKYRFFDKFQVSQLPTKDFEDCSTEETSSLGEKSCLKALFCSGLLVKPEGHDIRETYEIDSIEAEKRINRESGMWKIAACTGLDVHETVMESFHVTPKSCRFLLFTLLSLFILVFGLIPTIMFSFIMKYLLEDGIVIFFINLIYLVVITSPVFVKYVFYYVTQDSLFFVITDSRCIMFYRKELFNYEAKYLFHDDWDRISYNQEKKRFNYCLKKRMKNRMKRSSLCSGFQILGCGNEGLFDNLSRLENERINDILSMINTAKGMFERRKEGLFHSELDSFEFGETTTTTTEDEYMVEVSEEEDVMIM